MPADPNAPCCWWAGSRVHRADVELVTAQLRSADGDLARARIICGCRDASRTILMDAVIRGNPSMVALLVEYGADVNAPNAYGCSALHLSRMLRHKTKSPQIWRTLLEAAK